MFFKHTVLTTSKAFTIYNQMSSFCKLTVLTTSKAPPVEEIVAGQEGPRGGVAVYSLLDRYIDR